MDAKDKNGFTAIMYAAVNEHHKVMKLDLISASKATCVVVRAEWVGWGYLERLFPCSNTMPQLPTAILNRMGSFVCEKFLEVTTRDNIYVVSLSP